MAKIDKEEQRLAEIKALKKERAHNNARIKAELLARGEMPDKKRKAPLRQNAVQNSEPAQRPQAKSEMATSVTSSHSRREEFEMREIEIQKQRLEQIERDLNAKLAHIEAVTRYQSQPHMNPPSGIILASNGMPDQKEIVKVRSEISEIYGAIQMLATQIANMNAGRRIELESLKQNLAHVEAVTCCSARVPYNSQLNPHVPVTPHVNILPNGQIAPAEFDRVREEIREIRQSMRDQMNALAQYNMGKMHGEITATRNGTQAQGSQLTGTPIMSPPSQTPQPSQPIIINSPPQSTGPGQPIVVNNIPSQPIPGLSQPAQPNIQQVHLHQDGQNLSGQPNQPITVNAEGNPSGDNPQFATPIGSAPFAQVVTPQPVSQTPIPPTVPDPLEEALKKMAKKMETVGDSLK